MRNLFRLLLLCLFLIIGWNFFQGDLKDEWSKVKEQSEIIKVTESLLLQNFHAFFQELTIDQSDKIEHPEERKIVPPKNKEITLYHISIGDDKTSVEGTLGKPERITKNEYGLSWHTYHKNYRTYIQIMYDQNEKIVGVYSNQNTIEPKDKISIGSTKEEVRNQYGDPLRQIQKGFIVYELQSQSNYDLYEQNGDYITLFYDIHNNQRVTAIQIIEGQLERKKKELYTDYSEALREGFEYQLFDLTNATRVRDGYPVLTWDDHVRETARKHSDDMAKNHYFNHTNSLGESPFDRMKSDHIPFSVAGENLAFGQSSSIFAHEGLMNSIGHRKNILNEDFEFLGVGVSFDEDAHPYYTENFYRK